MRPACGYDDQANLDAVAEVGVGTVAGVSRRTRTSSKNPTSASLAAIRNNMQCVRSTVANLRGAVAAGC